MKIKIQFFTIKIRNDGDIKEKSLREMNARSEKMMITDLIFQTCPDLRPT